MKLNSLVKQFLMDSSSDSDSKLAMVTEMGKQVLVLVNCSSEP